MIIIIGKRMNKQKGAAIEGPPAMGPSLQLSTCVLFWRFLGLFVPTVEGTKPRSSSVSSQANAILTLPTVFGLLRPFRFRSKWSTVRDRRTDRRWERPLPW